MLRFGVSAYCEVGKNADAMKVEVKFLYNE